jgi:hypothetical protein
METSSSEIQTSILSTVSPVNATLGAKKPSGDPLYRVQHLLVRGFPLPGEPQHNGKILFSSFSPSLYVLIELLPHQWILLQGV